MAIMRKVLFFLFLFVFALGLPALWAEGLEGVPGVPADAGGRSHWRGLEYLKDPGYMASILVTLAAAAILGAIITYHPIRRKFQGRDPEAIETPKVHILIASGGALMAVVVSALPYLAFGLLGMGAFLRFRTTVRNPKELAVLFAVLGIGMCCGLELYAHAVVATVFFFALIWLLDAFAPKQGKFIKAVIKGLDEETTAAADCYREVLEAVPVEVVRAKVNTKKGKVSFTIRLPSNVPIERVEQALRSVEDFRPKSIGWSEQED